jgi:hypothetical protein
MRTAAIAGALLFLAVAPAWAHHAFAAEFDAGATESLYASRLKPAFSTSRESSKRARRAASAVISALA